MIEKIALVVFAIGIILFFFTYNYIYFIQISIVLCMVTYIIIAFHSFNYYAYQRKIKIIDYSEEEFDDSELENKNILLELIMPKVLWLSNAASLLGILFYTLNTGNNGYLNALLVGGSTICFALIVFIFTFIKKGKIHNELGFILIRSIPILLISLYIVYI